MAKKRVIPKGDLILKGEQSTLAQADYHELVRKITSAAQKVRRDGGVIESGSVVVVRGGSGQGLKRLRTVEPASPKGLVKLAKGVRPGLLEQATVSQQAFSVGRPATTATELPKAKLKMIERLLVSLPRN